MLLDNMCTALDKYHFEKVVFHVPLEQNSYYMNLFCQFDDINDHIGGFMNIFSMKKYNCTQHNFCR